MKRAFFVLPLLLIVQSAPGQGIFVFDQQSTNLIEGTGGLQEGQPMGQSFTPSLSFVDFVMLNLYDGGSLPLGATVYVNLRSNSITGPIFSVSDSVFMPDNFAGIVNFSFSKSVSVMPGLTYFLEPVVQSGDGWGTLVTDGSYTGGTAIYQGVAIADRDLWFREGIVVPEPSSAWLAALGAGLLIGWQSLRRRGRAGIPRGT